MHYIFYTFVDYFCCKKKIEMMGVFCLGCWKHERVLTLKWQTEKGKMIYKINFFSHQKIEVKGPFLQWGNAISIRHGTHSNLFEDEWEERYVQIISHNSKDLTCIVVFNFHCHLEKIHNCLGGTFLSMYVSEEFLETFSWEDQSLTCVAHFYCFGVRRKEKASLALSFTSVWFLRLDSVWPAISPSCQ